MGLSFRSITRAVSDPLGIIQKAGDALGAGEVARFYTEGPIGNAPQIKRASASKAGSLLGGRAIVERRVRQQDEGKTHTIDVFGSVATSGTKQQTTARTGAIIYGAYMGAAALGAGSGAAGAQAGGAAAEAGGAAGTVTAGGASSGTLTFGQALATTGKVVTTAASTLNLANALNRPPARPSWPGAQAPGAQVYEYQLARDGAEERAPGARSTVAAGSARVGSIAWLAAAALLFLVMR